MSIEKISLLPILKVAVRLLDLHDSERGLGESTQYQTEDRRGLKNGYYFAIAEEVLFVLQEQGTRSGEEYSSLTSIVQAVQERIEWAAAFDIEYALNVLSRPTELKLLHHSDGVPGHAIGDKETNLVDKASYIAEYRISKIGKTALTIASDNLDITYIEGDVTKLIRAIEAGRMTSALGFVERLLQQLRTEHLSLIALIEQASGGRKTRPDAIADLELHRKTMSRAVDLVEEARSKIDEVIRKEIVLIDEVPIGLIKAKVKELSGGVVRYGRELTHLAEISMRNTSSSVQAPSFLNLAKRWVRTPPTNLQLSTVLSILGPTYAINVAPMGTDFTGIVKPRTEKNITAQNLQLEGFSVPFEDQFLEWLQNNQAELNQHIHSGVLGLSEALRQGLGNITGEAALNCLVTALTMPDEWINTSVDGEFTPELERSQVPGLDVMFSKLELKKLPNNSEDLA